VAALEPAADALGRAGSALRAQRFPELTEATAGGRRETFALDWYLRRWSSPLDHQIADFPFVAEIGGKRYELYGDQTFNEEEVSRYAAPAGAGAVASP
jgi:hypothetical protein